MIGGLPIEFKCSLLMKSTIVLFKFIERMKTIKKEVNERKGRWDVRGSCGFLTCQRTFKTRNDVAGIL